jgi:hypothetical protein
MVLFGTLWDVVIECPRAFRFGGVGLERPHAGAGAEPRRPAAARDGSGGGGDSPGAGPAITLPPSSTERAQRCNHTSTAAIEHAQVNVSA